MNSNSLSEQNTKAFAEYLYRVAGSPEGKAKEHWENAEKQLEQNLFDETGPVPWITSEQLAERARAKRGNRTSEGGTAN